MTLHQRRLTLRSLSLALPSSLLLVLSSQAVRSESFTFGDHSFSVPEGYILEQIAGPPLVNRPIVADFDEKGRLYVADSSGSNDPVQKQLEEKPHRIVRLEDTDGDGHFDTQTVFADAMMFPEGILYHQGAVYCSAPPTIWKLEDLDDDGVADKRTPWFEGKTLTGCANDLHGPYLGPDGWIYWCKGAFAQQTFQRPGHPPTSDSAAHIFRQRPNGTAFDSVMSGGMDNPVDVVFTPEGEAFFTTTFYAHPREGRRDALVHAIYGGVYPKEHGVLNGLTRTGDFLPAMTHLGPAAPCGFAYSTSDALGEGFLGNLFSCHFNLRRVQRHVLLPNGSTYSTEDEDFLTSDHPDFHPTDVLMDADGSLVVLDTGGWYKLCCPTSQLVKPEVLGAIYRIRKNQHPNISDPRGLEIPWQTLTPKELVSLLSSNKPAVRQQAIERLGALEDKAIPALKDRWPEAHSVRERQDILWTLTRMLTPQARSFIRSALKDPSESVVRSAVHSIAVHRDALAMHALHNLFPKVGPHAQRQIATALGAIRNELSVPVLLQQAPFMPDRMAEHSLIYALIEIGSEKATLKGLQSSDPRVQRAALIALDQMPNSQLPPLEVLSRLEHPDPLLQQTAIWLLGFHPEWGEHLLATFQKRYDRFSSLSLDQQAVFQKQLAQFATNPSVQSQITLWLQSNSLSRQKALFLLPALEASRTFSESWINPLKRFLQSKNPATVQAALQCLIALPWNKSAPAAFNETLQSMATQAHLEPLTRLQALDQLPNGLESIPTSLFTFLTQELAPEQGLLHRSISARVLSRSRLSPPQQISLCDLLPTLAPMQINQLIPLLKSHSDSELGVRFFKALDTLKDFQGISSTSLSEALQSSSAPVQALGTTFLKQRLSSDPKERQAKLESLMNSLPAGDIKRGHLVFNSPQSSCILCHQVGYKGGKIGPELSRIGSIRTEMDLLESILYPNASFVRSYEPVRVITSSGDEYSGVSEQDSAGNVLLRTGPDQSITLSSSEISEMIPGSVSLMPEGLTAHLTPTDLADLIAFLKNLR